MLFFLKISSSEMDGEMDVHQEYYLCTKTDQEHQTNKTDMLTACEILMLWCQAGSVLEVKL